MYYSSLIYGKCIIPESLILSSTFLGATSLWLVCGHQRIITGREYVLAFYWKGIVYPIQLKFELNPCPRKRKARKSFLLSGKLQRSEQRREGKALASIPELTLIAKLQFNLSMIYNQPRTWKPKTGSCRVSLKIVPFVCFLCMFCFPN